MISARTILVSLLLGSVALAAPAPLATPAAHRKHKEVVQMSKIKLTGDVAGAAYCEYRVACWCIAVF